MNRFLAFVQSMWLREQGTAERIAIALLNVVGIGTALALLVLWPLWTLLVAVLHVGATHVFYAAIMNYKRVIDAGHEPPVELRVLMAVVLLVGYVLDIALNFMWTPLAGLRFVPKFTFSGTMAQWKFHGTGHRQAIGAYACPKWLDHYDPSGCHCHAD